MANQNDSHLKGTLWRRLLRFSLALIVLFGCYWLSADSARLGLTRFFSMLAIIQSTLEPANTAVRLTPNDPEAHYTRALALINLQRLDEAVGELRIATQLRPHHYYEWLDLGVTLDRLGDRNGAVNALQESIRLAPSFAQPHWQMGNLLYREGRYPEAFVELRFGARSNPNLAQGMLDLAWVAANGDVERFVALIQPDSRRRHFELAWFLAKQGKGVEAANQVRAAGPYQDEQERSLLYLTTAELLAAGNFSDAFDVWAINHPSNAGKGQIVNGDFLDPILQDEPGFGWQIPKMTGVQVSIDPSGPVAGTRGLRIEFGGDSIPANAVVNQLVLLPPNTRYSLSFMARAENLVTGGPPVIAVMDVSTNPPKILGQSKPVPPGTGDWEKYSTEFSTVENTSAVVIRLQRLQCSQLPCPVFGRLWLSRFVLNKI